MNINLEYQIMKKDHLNRPHAAEMKCNYVYCWCVCQQMQTQESNQSV